MGTDPNRIERLHGMVSSMIVEPARAPTPTLRFSCASGPSPEKSMIAPSGTAPRTGSTTEPTMPETLGTISKSSEPLESILLAANKIMAYTAMSESTWTRPQAQPGLPNEQSGSVLPSTTMHPGRLSGSMKAPGPSSTAAACGSAPSWRVS